VTESFRRRRAFSLIELLVVMGIIAVLIGLLFPALARARQQAKRVQCLSQLHQLGVALTGYAGANHGRYPSFGNWEVYGGDGTGEDDDADLGWAERLEPHTGRATAGLYRCPAFPPETDFNYFLSGKWASVRGRDYVMQTDVRRASEFILAGECTHQRLYPPPAGMARYKLYTNDCDKDDVMWKCLSFSGEEFGWTAHVGGNNVLFGDGHAATCARFDHHYMTYDPQTGGVDWNQIVPP